MKPKRSPEAFLRRLWALEAQLVQAGFQPMPRWWRETIERFYVSGKRRVVVRKGRRVYASTCVAPRLAVAEMLFGQHTHIHGSPPLVFAFLSVKRDEAGKRLLGVSAILHAIGEKYAERGETIELKDRPAVFAVVTANHRTNVGDTVAFAWLDELCSWSDDELGANPAEMVVGRLAPALSTLPDAKMFLVSSPLGPDDYHARQFDLGDTPAQYVAFGNTWTINPDLTEEACEELEPHEPSRRREYGAIPSSAISPAFPAAAVERSFRDAPAAADWAEPVCIVDASSGGGDSFTWTTAQYITPAPGDIPQFLQRRVPRQVNTLIRGIVGTAASATDTYQDVARDLRGNPLANPAYAEATRPTAVFNHVGSFDGRFAGSIAGSQIVEQIARSCRNAGVSTVIGDQREAFFLGSEFARQNLRFIPIAWTNQNKIEAVVRLRRMFAEDTIVLPLDRPKLKKELLGYSERITSSGAITYSARGTGRDDEAALLITFALGELERVVPGSPAHIKNYRHEVSGR